MRTLAAWARELEARSPRTARRYGREATAWGAFVERARGAFPGGMLSASPADVRAFVNLDDGLSASSRGVKVAALRGMYTALEAEGLVAENPAGKVRVGRTASGVHHRAIPRSTVLRVLAKLAESDKAKDVRDRALIIVMLSVGARRAEVAGLKVGSIERDEDGAFLVLRGKGDKTVRMPLRDGAVRAIGRWLEVAGHGDDPDAPLFTNVSRRPDHRGRPLTAEGIYHICKRLFPGYSPHGLRARSVTDVYENSDGNIHFAQMFARHASPTVTEAVYVQTKKLEKAMVYAPDYQ
jgi:site-specific recombinase XerC